MIHVLLLSAVCGLSCDGAAACPRAPVATVTRAVTVEALAIVAKPVQVLRERKPVRRAAARVIQAKPARRTVKAVANIRPVRRVRNAVANRPRLVGRAARFVLRRR